jgi:predicted tellurium resistance membrane protein TerC
MSVLSRILLLFSLSWIIGLSEPLVSLFGFEISGRDIVLILGGLFLLAKSTYEIHQKLEGIEGHTYARVKTSFLNVIVQVLLLDVVFSLDSVVTAVGMVDQLEIMVTAVVIAAGVMILLARPLGEFVDRHPTIKILALSFLLLIGFTLIVEGLHQHIPKGYIYFAMGFSVFVERLNLRLRKGSKAPVHLLEAYADEGQPTPPHSE